MVITGTVFRSACLTFAAIGVFALSLAGCGGSGGSSTVAGAVGHEAAAVTPAVVKVAATPDLGVVLVDSDGRTLYDSHRDDPMLYQFGRPSIPSCYGACAEAWPPLLTAGPPEAIGAARDSLLGTIRRKDGSSQVTYDGRPLYTYVRDEQPGETSGDGILSYGSRWHALESNGQEP